ncbi:hypothetical protein [Plantactinospora sp. GCM10030261]|uniref:hypothetical protein n=1 Tax=Plantactinospora sp. GCM10030261 TaxID=3273420 RepID=UPI003616088B
MIIRRGGLLALAVGLTVAAAACGHDTSAGETLGTAPAPTATIDGGSSAAPAPDGTGAPVMPDGSGVPAGSAAVPGQPAAPGGAVPPVPSATQPTKLAALPPTADSDPSCRPPVLLEATEAALTTTSLARVEVLGCRGGVARLLAVTDPESEIPGGNQVFLRLDKGIWRVAGRVSSGTDCGDPHLTTDIRSICTGLA